ncbi:hypothetical protein tb265_13690 [Gemmatimonadetes bacterium T265]|nr:hypothetical protein tb265_13690 [Gemmatimonadetes bacterium T265]
MPRVVALFRKSSYSPAQHRTNDTAILDDTLAHFVAAGWAVERIDEAVLDAAARDDGGAVPEAVPADADLYLSMCQGPATARLLGLEAAGARLINRPSSVLGCHRHRLVPALAAAGVPFPATDVLDLATADAATVAASPVVRAASAAGGRVWIKRGDVHAERADDVVAVPAADAAGAAAEFRARGIGRIALQADVAGPVIKFYGVADGRFFRWYDAAAGLDGPRPVVDETQLRALAFAAARALGLEVFGGDVALPAPDAPVLIDLNDWPSFAPFRAEAAAAIATYALTRVDDPAALTRIDEPAGLARVDASLARGRAAADAQHGLPFRTSDGASRRVRSAASYAYDELT